MAVAASSDTVAGPRRIRCSAAFMSFPFGAAAAPDAQRSTPARQTGWNSLSLIISARATSARCLSQSTDIVQDRLCGRDGSMGSRKAPWPGSGSRKNEMHEDRDRTESKPAAVRSETRDQGWVAVSVRPRMDGALPGAAMCSLAALDGPGQCPSYGDRPHLDDAVGPGAP
jgi:hypothetical protein